MENNNESIFIKNDDENIKKANDLLKRVYMGIEKSNNVMSDLEFALSNMRGILIREDRYNSIYSSALFYCINIENLIYIQKEYGLDPSDDDASVMEFWIIVEKQNIIVGKGDTAIESLQDYLNKGGKIEW